MKLMFTICLIFVLTEGFGQQDQAGSGCPQPCRTVAPTSVRIRIRCQATSNSPEPLFIVDGVLADSSMIKKIDPNTIERIDVLKDAAAAAIYGRAARSGVVIITTKKVDKNQFLVKDRIDGKGIGGATVSFSSKNQTLMFVSDSTGRFSADGLKADVEYAVTVSSVGYLESSISYLNSKGKSGNEISLDKNIKPCPPVIVTGYGGCICKRIWGRCSSVYCNRKIASDTAQNYEKSSFANVYPNPVQRGQRITIELRTDRAKEERIKIYALDGREMFSTLMNFSKGLNRFSIPVETRWSAGVYLVQVGQKDQLVKQEKIIIQ